MGTALFCLAMIELKLRKLMHPLLVAVALPACAAGPSLTIAHEGTNTIMNFTGRLQVSSKVQGPYTNVPGIMSPYRTDTSTADHQFWRSRFPGIGILSAGSGFTAALKVDGTLWMWGWNDNGQLGNGGYVQSNEPGFVNQETNWAVVSCGTHFTAAIKADGTLWQWGGNQTNRPTQVSSDRDWLAVSCGGTHFIALKRNGSLWGSGDNGAGQLGTGTNPPYTFGELVQVGTDLDWKTVAAGFLVTVAIKTNGTLWAWGDNDGFQTSSGSFVSTNRPAQLGSDTDWEAVACGFKPAVVSEFQGYAIASKKNGSLWGFGYNVFGQLGIGTYTGTNQPTRIGLDTNWIGFACRDYATLALRSDGTLWGWGRSPLGDGGTYTRTNQPVQINSETNWIAVACGTSHTLALKSDGSLWAWGSNSSGQLGIGGSGFSVSIPTRVGPDNDWGN
jgi:alpha-tubulin suppressor-like RCC1 family protein